MTQRILTLIISILFIQTTFGNPIKKLELKPTYSNYYSNNRIVNGNLVRERLTNLGIEVLYKCNNTFSAGIYGGWLADRRTITVSSYQYGASAQYNVLPHIIKREKFRLAFGAKAHIGQHYFPFHFYIMPDYRLTEFGFGPYAQLQLMQHLGVFTNYTWGQYYQNEKTHFAIGISIKV